MTVKVTKPEINVREKLAELDRKVGVAGVNMLSAETPKQQFNMIGAGRKNLLINGNFKVWQRRTSHTYSGTSWNYGSADRWRYYTLGGSAGTATISKTTITVDGVTRDALDWNQTVANSANRPVMEQIVEDNNIPPGSTLTFSLFIASIDSDSDHLDGELKDQSNGGLGPYMSVYSGTDGTVGSKVLQRGWNSITVTITTPSNLRCRVHFPTNRTFRYAIACAQLELGPVATPFEERFFGEELALCQRYYTVLAAGADYPEEYSGGSSHVIGTMHKWNTTNTFIFTELPTQMRTSAYTIVKSSGAADFSFKSAGYTSTGNDLTLDGDSSSRVVRLNSAVTNSGWPLGCSGWVRCNVNSAFIALDAEL